MKLFVTAAMLIVSTAGVAVGQTGTLIAQLNQSEPASGDKYGYSIAIDGGVVVVGAPGIRRAFSFDISTLTSPSELAKYSPVDLGPGGISPFGEAVGVSGDKVVIGDPGNLEAGILGSVSIFSSDSPLLLNIEEEAFAGFTWLGLAVDAHHGVALAGAPRTNAHEGAAKYVDMDTYAVNHRSPPVGYIGLEWEFGHSVSLSSNHTAVGVPMYKPAAGIASGGVEIYSADGGVQQWTLSQAGADRNSQDAFGESVALSNTNNNIVLIGAPEDDEAASGAGAAYLFDLTTGAQLYKLMASDATVGGDFGRSVTIAGNYALVGAPFAQVGFQSRGGVYIFDISTGVQVMKIDNPYTGGGVGSGRFGHSVDASGHVLAIGSYFPAGAAYIYELSCSIGDFSAPFGIMNSFDVSAFVTALGAEDPRADINGDGIWNFFDVNLFLAAYGAGCP